MKTVYEIHGSKFSTLEEFFGHLWEAFSLKATWGENLDAFNDILRGGFGTPMEGFVVHWIDSDLSKLRLGYDETIRQLEMRLQECHPSNRAAVEVELNKAKKHTGDTVFDWLVEIFRDHGIGGSQPADGIELKLL